MNETITCGTCAGSGNFATNLGMLKCHPCKGRGVVDVKISEPAVCRGSLALKTACGKCSRCKGTSVERDERADFETCYVDWFNRTHSQDVARYTVEEMKASRDGECYGHGSNGKNLRWLGWQARAALERKS